MGAGSVVRRLVEMTGHKIYRISKDAYDQDGLYSIHNHEFMSDSRFARAYQRGCRAAGDTASEYGWHWRVPGTLSQIDTRRIAYLHLDMNCSAPEVAALNFLWDRLLPGAIVLLDDYAYHSYESQKRAMDAEARTKNVSIASLPTGQGMLIKAPAAA